RAALAALGRETKHDAWLAQQFASTDPQDPGRGYHRIASWGPCARFYLETGNLGEDFEKLVRAFEAEGHNARSVHLGVTDYYVSVAHARIHQSLRAERSKRDATLPALRAAVADLKASAKIPLLKAHRLLAEGSLAWFEGHERKAKALLTDAEALANQQSC